MDRALSFFGVYDVFGYLASGASLVIGVWWVVAGQIPHLSTVAVFGLLGASYIAGQVAASLGHNWELLWWKAMKGKPYVRMFEKGDYGFGEDLRRAIDADLEAGVGIRSLTVQQRFNFARTKLRLTGTDSRAETMRAMHGLCRNLAASAGVIFVVAAVKIVVDGWDERVWVTAAFALVAAPLFGWRAMRFEWRFGREVWLGYLALRM